MRIVLIILLSLCTAVAAVGGYFLFQSAGALDELTTIRKPAREHVSMTSETKPGAEAEEGAHAQPPAEGGGHGASPPPGAFGAAPISNIIKLQEVLVNVSDPDDVHYLKVRLELQLFDAHDKPRLLKFRSGLRNAVIEVTREQSYRRLHTITGKLYFKELLTSRMNQFLNQPAIREVHFTEFYLQ